jgi:hypothetical protein
MDRRRETARRARASIEIQIGGIAELASTRFSRPMLRNAARTSRLVASCWSPASLRGTH